MKHILFFFSAIVMAAALGAGPARAQNGLTWYDPLAAPGGVPAVQGRAWNTETGARYQRLPQRAEAAVRKPLWDLSLQTAGLYVQFATSAPQLTVRYGVTGSWSMPHMPATGVSGVDLYATDANGRQYWCKGTYAFADTVRYHYAGLGNPPGSLYLYTLYLPLYNGVRFLQIGVPEGSAFRFLPPSAERPVVVYGTSIAQGACASRPGMAWTNQLQRRLDCPVVNLGFSGNGQLEPELFSLLAEIDAAAYVIDCMPNMTDGRADLIASRLTEGLRLLRRAGRKAPVILVEHDGYMAYPVQPAEGKRFMRTNAALREVYEKMKTEAAPLHYLTQRQLGLSMDSQVDGVHATDLGMTQYADAYTRLLRSLLYPGADSLGFTPCRQHRDAATYSWSERHNAVLAQGAARQPDVVLIGNSITHFWGGEPREPRRVVADDVWRSLFRGHEVMNMGFGWDRIENIAWRLLHGELSGFSARQVWLMAGTNNLDVNTDEEIVAGVQALVRLARICQPQAEVSVIGILPRRDREARISRLNARLAEALRGSGVRLIDAGSGLLQADGRIDEQLFSDGLHPNRRGYARMARALRPCLHRPS